MAEGQYILHLPAGVALSKIESAEDQMDARLNELAGGTVGVASEPIVYDQLPDWFIVGQRNHWPAWCNLRCASCTLTFQGQPWFIPVEMKQQAVEDQQRPGCTRMAQVFKRKLVTCTPNCSVTYIETHMKGEQAAQAKELLVHLYFAVHGARVHLIPPAPRHTELQAYGGQLSDLEFWEKMRGLAQETGQSTKKFNFAPVSAELENAPDGWRAAEKMIVPLREEFGELRAVAAVAAVAEPPGGGGAAGDGGGFELAKLLASLT